MKGPVNRRTDEGASEQTDVVKLDFKVLCCSVFAKTVKFYVGILTVAISTIFSSCKPVAR